METKKYILEYSEEQGRFHFNSGIVPQGTFGWATLCKTLSYSQCLEFVRLMEDKYPAVHFESDSENYPSIELIKQDFINFLLT